MVKQCQLVIFSYEKSQKLDSQNRNVIAGSIIKYILNTNPSQGFVRADFEKIAALICEVFKLAKEKPSVYYMVVDGRSRGKLYNAYSNYKTKLGSTAVIDRKKYSSKVEIPKTVVIDGRRQFI